MYDGNWPPGVPVGLSAAEMLEQMDKYNVGVSWISPASSFVNDFTVYNEGLYCFITTDAKRFRAFYVVNPIFTEKSLNEIRLCTEYRDCRGIKLHPWLSGFSVSYACVRKVVEECIKYKLPILFHDGTPPYSDSLQIADLARLYPEAKIILGHSGLLDTYRSAIIASRKYENIYLCLCGPMIEDIRQIIKEADQSRIIFGSDFGMKNSGLMLENRLKLIDYAVENKALKNKIYYENAVSLIE
jgi:predicted TIM-barrel fold metal-dependent hydrolase